MSFSDFGPSGDNEMSGDGDIIEPAIVVPQVNEMPNGRHLMSTPKQPDQISMTPKPAQNPTQKLTPKSTYYSAGSACSLVFLGNYIFLLLVIF